MSACAIIVSYRTGPALEWCLRALLAAEGLNEILVADNGNDAAGEALLDAAGQLDPRLRVLRGHGNVGFAAACNLAVRYAQADVLAFINPDVILEHDAVPRLLTVLNAAPPPAIAGGDLRDEQGRPDRGSRRESLTLWRAFVSASGLSSLEQLSPLFRDFNRHLDPMPALPEPVGAVSGALFAVRRADFEALGGFDEGYFLHVEDVDLCRRANDAGWRVLFAPGPHGTHLRSTADAPSSTVALYKARGFARYFRKFAHGPLHRVVGEIATAGLILAAKLRAA
ncbi:MAG: glycosyltransferase family 2 protein [Hyphomonadaceae bacterium]